MRLKIFVEDMSKKITEIYTSDPVKNRSIFKSQSACLLKGDHKTVAIYLYKRELLKLDRSEIISWLSSQEGKLHPPLFNSFINKTFTGEFTEISNYIIKNDHIEYIYKGNIIQDVKSYRKEIRNNI